MDDEPSDQLLIDQDPEGDNVEPAASIMWICHKIDGVQSKWGEAKTIICIFCISTFTGCSASQAVAHILGRAVLGHQAVQFKIAQFKIAQKVLNS